MKYTTYCEQCNDTIQHDHTVIKEVKLLHLGHRGLWVVPERDTLRDGTRIS